MKQSKRILKSIKEIYLQISVQDAHLINDEQSLRNSVTCYDNNGNEINFVEDITWEKVQANLSKYPLTTAEEDKQAKDNLKASAKAKLIAGEALTEDEANTIVL